MSCHTRVPQGSVLGPSLFLVLIGDIDAGITSVFLSSFADDTRVARGINSVDDVKELQADLQNIFKWADDSNMEFNYHKFECLRYGKNCNLSENTSYKTSTGATLKEVQ